MTSDVVVTVFVLRRLARTRAPGQALERFESDGRVVSVGRPLRGESREDGPLGLCVASDHCQVDEASSQHTLVLRRRSQRQMRGPFTWEIDMSRSFAAKRRALRAIERYYDRYGWNMIGRRRTAWKRHLHILHRDFTHHRLRRQHRKPLTPTPT